MPPRIAPLRGKDAWWDWVQSWWDYSTVVEIGVSTEEIIVVDDWAIERHSQYQTTIYGYGDEPTSLYLKGIWVFHQQVDGSWKIARYIWNENLPPD